MLHEIRDFHNSEVVSLQTQTQYSLVSVYQNFVGTWCLRNFKWVLNE